MLNSLPPEIKEIVASAVVAQCLRDADAASAPERAIRRILCLALTSRVWRPIVFRVVVKALAETGRPHPQLGWAPSFVLTMNARTHGISLQRLAGSMRCRSSAAAAAASAASDDSVIVVHAPSDVDKYFSVQRPSVCVDDDPDFRRKEENKYPFCVSSILTGSRLFEPGVTPVAFVRFLAFLNAMHMCDRDRDVVFAQTARRLFPDPPLQIDDGSFSFLADSPEGRRMRHASLERLSCIVRFLVDVRLSDGDARIGSSATNLVVASVAPHAVLPRSGERHSVWERVIAQNFTCPSGSPVSLSTMNRSIRSHALVINKKDPLTPVLAMTEGIVMSDSLVVGRRWCAEGEASAPAVGTKRKRSDNSDDDDDDDDDDEFSLPPAKRKARFTDIMVSRISVSEHYARTASKFSVIVTHFEPFWRDTVFRNWMTTQ